MICLNVPLQIYFMGGGFIFRTGSYFEWLYVLPFKPSCNYMQTSGIAFFWVLAQVKDSERAFLLVFLFINNHIYSVIFDCFNLKLPEPSPPPPTPASCHLKILKKEFMIQLQAFSTQATSIAHNGSWVFVASLDSPVGNNNLKLMLSMRHTHVSCRPDLVGDLFEVLNQISDYYRFCHLSLLLYVIYHISL